MAITDRPVGPIAHCKHVRTLHQHGTATGYSKCGCRCEHCTTAAARDRRTHRDRKAAAEAKAPPTAKLPAAKSPSNYIPAREKTPFGQFELKATHLTTNTPGQNLQGTWLSGRPNITTAEARATALTVLHHVDDDTDAALIIDTLGIREFIA